MATQALKLHKIDTNTKRVGINLATDTNPEYPLDVNGSIRIFAGNLLLNNSARYPRIIFRPRNATNNGSDTFGPATIYVNTGADDAVTRNQLFFQLYSPTSSDPSNSTYTAGSEYYYLPRVDAGLTNETGYAIITTKNLSSIGVIPISQGGTGATSSSGALSNLGAAAASHTHAAADITSGTLSLARGGTGTSAASSSSLLSTLINSLTEGTNDANINDFIIAQSVNGGTTTTTYYRRSLSHIFTAIPAASSSGRGVVTTGNQTFSGRKTMSLINPVVYDGTGNTSRYKYVYFKNNSDSTVGVIRYDSGDATNVSDGIFSFLEYSGKSTADTTTTGFYERYKLPAVTTNLSESKAYDILTTKNTITVGQGGTGATTLTSGAALIGNGTGAITTRTIYHQTALGHCDYNNHINHLITDSTLAYWNGRYSDTASNLTYYKNGTIYGSGHFGWKRVTIDISSGRAGVTSCTGATTDSVVIAQRYNNVNYDDSGGQYSTIGAAAVSSSGGTVRVWTSAGSTGSSNWSISLFWTKTATGG